jgi:rubrerythrin
MTPYRLLEQLLALEQRVRQVYVLLSQRQQFPVDLRTVWKALAEDETHHIVALERSAHLFSVMEVPPTIPDHVLASVEAILATAEAATQQTSLSSDDALRQALRIEGSELNHLDEAWRHGFRSTTNVLLQALAPETQKHVRRLFDAVHRFSTDTMLHAEADAVWKQYDKPHKECNHGTGTTD